MAEGSAGEETKKRYIIIRDDYLLLYTKPITREEAEWLRRDAYWELEDENYNYLDRWDRARYLEEYGNVIDVDDYIHEIDSLTCTEEYDDLPCYDISPLAGVYNSLEELEERLASMYNNEELEPKYRRAAKEVADELLAKVRELMERPVKPRPAAARYFERASPHVEVNRYTGEFERIEPQPEWYAYELLWDIPREVKALYGISVFPGEFWLYAETRKPFFGVAVRRDASIEEAIEALAKDGPALLFFKIYGQAIKELLDEHEDEMRRKGYGDVVDKARALLEAAEEIIKKRRKKSANALPA